MARPGSRQIQTGRADRWGGRRTTSLSHAALLDLVGGYVGPDGQEVRSMPGWKCVADLASEERSPLATGYTRETIDVARPGMIADGGYFIYNPSPSDTQTVWTRPLHWHCAEPVRNKLLIVGEASWRREPIRDGGGTEVGVDSWNRDVGTGEAILVLDGNPVNGADFHEIEVGDVISFEGGEDTNAADLALLNDRFHEVTALPAANQIQVSTVVAAASGTSTVGATIGKTRGNQSGTYPVDYFGEVSQNEIPDVPSLMLWTVEDSLDDENPVTSCHPAHVANRIPDFGDDPVVDWEGHEIVNGGPGYSRRRQRSLPFRVSPHIAGDRLILAAENYGCVFQCPVITTPAFAYGIPPGVPGIDHRYNSTFDRPRSLGVPKAVLLDHKGLTAGSTPQHSWVDGEVAAPDGLPQGVYRFQVAYRDDGTGEIGLASEVVELDLSAAPPSSPGFNWVVELYVLYPGYLLAETAAVSAMVFMSDTDGEVLGHFFTSGRNVGFSVHQGIPPTSNASPTEYLWRIVIPSHKMEEFNNHGASEAIDFGTPPPELQQMPMGCKTARTIRGVSLFGGYLGTHGKEREVQRGTISLRIDSGTTNNSFPEADELNSRLADDNAVPVDSPWACAQSCLPPAYAGNALFSRELYPFPYQSTRVRKMSNSWAAISGGTPEVPAKWHPRYKMDRRPVSLDQTITNTGAESFLILPRGRFQASEQGFPGVTPAPLQKFTDAEEDEDVEAIGTFRGVAALFTRSSTFALAWSRSPIGNHVRLVNNEFGAICRNTAEFDYGCAFLSDRGPAVFTGGSVAWIGRDLERDFYGETARFRRDSQGLMRHSWIAHDPERQCIYFGVFADRAGGGVTIDHLGTTYDWDTAPDEARSRFPCDTILVFSYNSGSWSEWHMPAGLEVLWMTRMPDIHGNERMIFLAADGRLYALDDNYGDRVKEPTPLTADAAVTTPAAAFATSTTFNSANRYGADDDVVEVGMHAVLEDGNGNFIGATTVAGITGSTVVLNDPFAWPAGAILRVGVRPPMRLRSAWRSPTGAAATDVDAVVVRHSLQSRQTERNVTSTTSITPQDQPQWMRARVYELNAEDMDQRIIDYTEHDSSARPVWESLGTTLAGQQVMAYTRFALGRALSPEISVEIETVGGAQVRLPDMGGEIA